MYKRQDYVSKLKIPQMVERNTDNHETAFTAVSYTHLDMNRANEVRPIFRSLGDIAQATGCAIVLIGHLNKAAGTQSTYRGLGSIDITAALFRCPISTIAHPVACAMSPRLRNIGRTSFALFMSTSAPDVYKRQAIPCGLAVRKRF